MRHTERRISITSHLSPDEFGRSLRSDVLTGLASTPKELPPKWFYDKAGSDLFDEITRLPEYYPTEAERQALKRFAPEIVEAAGADTLVELGSGSSDKTRVLLDAMQDSGRLRRYVPFDVSGSALREAAVMLAERYPTLAIDGVVGDFDRHLDRIPGEAGDGSLGAGRRMVAFLGGTVGNYAPAPRHRLLATLAGVLSPGETLLMGTDLVKDPDRLVAAYDDRAGVTAAFNRNVLSVVNRELGADFVPEQFEHHAVWDTRNEWIEMRLRSTVEQTVDVRAIGLRARFRGMRRCEPRSAPNSASRVSATSWQLLGSSWSVGGPIRPETSRSACPDAVRDRVERLHADGRGWTGNDLQLVECTLESWDRLVSENNPLVAKIRRDGIVLSRRGEPQRGRVADAWWHSTWGRSTSGNPSSVLTCQRSEVSA